MNKINRNSPCPCGSGKRYKNCCMGKMLPLKQAAEFASPFYIGNNNVVLNVFLKALDYLIVPLCILTLAFDPNFLHGFVDHFESGHYLSVLNGIFSGKIPYKDFFVLFGPLQLYAVAFAMLLFGKTLSVLMTYFYVNYLLNLLIIYFLGRALCKNSFFVYLIPLICLLETTHPFWAARYDYGRTGVGILTLLLLIFFLKKKDNRLLFSIGCVSCITLLYSIDVGIITIISSVFFFAGLSLAQRNNPLKNKILYFLRIAIRYSIGMVSILSVFLLFLFFNNALSSFIETIAGIIKYHMQAWGQYIPPFEPAIRSMAFKLYLPVALYAAVFFYIVLSFVRNRWDEDKSVILLLFIYGILSYRASLRAITGPQFQVALPPLIILAALFLEKGANLLTAVRDRFKESGMLKKYDLIKVVSVILFFTLFFSYMLISPKRYYGTFDGWVGYQKIKKYTVATYMRPVLTSEMKLVKTTIERIGDSRVPDWQASKMENVVAYVKNNTSIDEEILCFPEHSLYNFLADRPAFSRFYIAAYAWSNPKWKSELLNEVTTKNPRTILYSTTLSNMAKCAGRSEELFPEIRNFISNNYHVVKIFDDIIICNRNERIKK